MRWGYWLMLVAGLSAALGPLPGWAESVYNRGNDSDPSTLDVQLSTTVGESYIFEDIYEGLMQKDGAGKLIPGVAKSWEIAPDGLTYTFHLREDARWSNGDPVTAGDFVYALRRLESPATAAPYANLLYMVHNAQAINTQGADPKTLGVNAPDAHTLKFSLDAPTPYFLELLSHHSTFPLHPATVEKYGVKYTRAEHLVTNGPYRLVRYTPNYQLTVRKNPYYYDAGQVAIDVVNFIPFEDRSACLRRFESGEVLSCSDIPLEQMAYMRQNLKDALRIAPYAGVYYLAVSVGKKKLSDPRVRQAISLAIDREFLSEDIWQGTMVPAYSYVPKGTANYGQPATLPYADEAPLDREDAARKLLREAGVKDGQLAVRLLYNTSENHRNTMTAVADMLHNIGIQARTEEMENTTYFNYLQTDGDFDMARAAWIPDYSDPQSYLFLNESTSKAFNYAKWKSPEYDRLMAEAAREKDLGVRAGLLKQAEVLLMHDLPVIPIFHYTSNQLVSPRLRGWQDNLQNKHASRWLSIAPQ